MKKKMIRIDDLYRFKFLREITLSVDGRRVAYTVEWMDRKKNKYFSNLYYVREDGQIFHLIRGDKNISQPRWSPNGKLISFIMTDKDNQNIWLMPMEGGEPYPLTKVKGSFGKYRWTPDGRNIICEFMEKKEDKERIPDKNKPPLYYYVTRVHYKHDGQGILPVEKMHIWKVSIRSGAMRQLTFGRNGDYAPNISPDGKKIIFISNRHSNYEEKFLYHDIFVIGLDGEKEQRIKTPAGIKDMPIFSPDGRYIVYAGRRYPEKFVGWRNIYLWSVPTRGGKTVCLTGSFDRTVYDVIIDDQGFSDDSWLRFSNDGRHLYFLGTDRGSTNLYQVDVKYKKVIKVLGDNERIYGFEYDGRDTFALAITRANELGDIYLLKDRTFKKLTTLNRGYMRNRRVSCPEEISFKGDEGHEIQGWLLKPPNFNKNKKYPLIVQIHGGPHMAYGNSFFHEFQVLAASGYCVFYSNPHGSMGYGERFARALHNRWGIPDSKDIFKGVKILTQRSYIDKKRIGVMGGSYGGFMTNWLIGHTNIFKVAVAMRSVVNMMTQFSSDFGFARDRQFIGPWWEKNNFMFYWNMSPLKYVKNIKTPLLIIHSEQDHRCPIAQAEELFIALKLLKRDVEMLRFPEECHELSRHGAPRRREERLEHILRFLNRCLVRQSMVD